MTASSVPSSRPPDRYRGRFAPSPTGPLHLGSLLAALASFLRARAHGGEWLLRIDDIDPQRSIPSAADAIRRTLERFGLWWDREVVFQSRRIEHYRHALNQLQGRGWVYACDCSRKHLAHTGPGAAVYPGRCRNKNLPDDGTALRLITTDTTIAFIDRLQGPIRHDLGRETGDFVIRRRDGAFAYHLATVVDDAEARISEVLRGADLLDSTPRQIHLQQLLQLPVPAYCHVPVLVDACGQKLSKQSFARSVETDDASTTLCRLLRLLRQQPPEALERAPPPEILRWAVAHWDVDRLIQTRTVPSP